ncbi:MAG TPA: hypothetical protein VKE25_06410 [Actinomycetes bacterium]|nr:hypothetical protein [Actinomycetes bacterium]
MDFLWRAMDTIGEADGRLKYTIGDVIYQEKRREIGFAISDSSSSDGTSQTFGAVRGPPPIGFAPRLGERADDAPVKSIKVELLSGIVTVCTTLGLGLIDLTGSIARGVPPARQTRVRSVRGSAAAWYSALRPARVLGALGLAKRS